MFAGGEFNKNKFVMVFHIEEQQISSCCNPQRDQRSIRRSTANGSMYLKRGDNCTRPMDTVFDLLKAKIEVDSNQNLGVSRLNLGG